jgi:hypothetical protein
MNFKTTIFLIFLTVFFTGLAESNKDSLLAVPKTQINKAVKAGTITTRKKTDKKIIILMILGLSIPLAAGYYVIKKK